MALKVKTDTTKIIVLSKDFDGVLKSRHVALYGFIGGKKLGEVVEGTGKTPQQAVIGRYSDLSSRTSDLIIKYIFVIDKISGKLKGYDNAIRQFAHKLFLKGDIPFDALVGTIQIDNENREALIGFDDSENHLNILEKVIKDYSGIGRYFNTKEPFVYRFGQESAVNQGVSALQSSSKCLFAAHTGFGKTNLSIKIANRYLFNGGIVLGLSPILDTIDGFKDAITGKYCLGLDRNQEYNFVNSNNINREDLLRRKSEGEVVYILMSVQDLTFDDIEKRYPELKGMVDLIIEDEGHKHYVGEKTSKRLRFLENVPTISLSATPHNIIGNYSKETIIDRSLIWALRNIEETKIPVPFIQGINTKFGFVSDALKSQYTIEEGFDPRKMVDTENKRFVYQSDLEKLPSLWYEDTRSRKKNALTIVNDTRLSDISKEVGLIVLPSGQEGDSAEEYLPRLASLWNKKSKGRYYITSYDVAKQSKSSGITVGAYVKNLLEKYRDGVSILTCRKFTTGTDIPQLGHIIVLDKICEPKEFEQLMGRCIRLLEGKEDVGIYITCPDVDIQITLGKLASKSVELNGGTKREVLDCLSLTGYDLEGNEVEYSAEDTISKIQEFYQSIAKNRISPNALSNALLDPAIRSYLDKIDLSDVRSFKEIGESKKITDSSGSKVSTSTPSNTNTSKKQDKSVTKIIELLNAFAIEMVWVAYYTEEYDALKIIKTDDIKEIFNSDEISVVTSIVMHDKIYNLFDKFLKVAKNAYSDLPLDEVHDDVFRDTFVKRKIDHVYTPMAAANEYIDEYIVEAYNKGQRNFLFINALSGSIPYAVKKRFPDVNIFCAEWHTRYKKYLKKIIPDCQVADLVLDPKTNLPIIPYDDMEFDVALTNPPFGTTTEHGDKGGSGNKALWNDITKVTLSRLKKGGILGCISPTVIVNGGDKFTNLVLGKNREVDLKSVDFSANDHFSQGIDICRWTAIKSKTPNNNVKVSNGSSYNTDKIHKIYSDRQFSDIVNTLENYEGDKLNFSSKNQYHMKQIEKDLIKKNLPVEWARDHVDSPTGTHKFPVNVNGKFKYCRVPGKAAGTWRLFMARFFDPLKIEISKEWEADASTFTMPFNSYVEAVRTQSYLNDPLYLWIIKKTSVSRRISQSIVSRFPNAPLSKVLNSDQLLYIESNIRDGK